jgi:hypothetical protein
MRFTKSDEEGRKVILNFLKNNKSNKYTINSLFRALCDAFPDYNFTRYKVGLMVEFLIATKEIMCLNLGFKVVWYEFKNK